jgi:hypothetical protein
MPNRPQARIQPLPSASTPIPETPRSKTKKLHHATRNSFKAKPLSSVVQFRILTNGHRSSSHNSHGRHPRPPYDSKFLKLAFELAPVEGLSRSLSLSTSLPLLCDCGPGTGPIPGGGAMPSRPGLMCGSDGPGEY